MPGHAVEPYLPPALHPSAEAGVRAIATDILRAGASGAPEQGAALLAAWCHARFGVPGRADVEALIERLVEGLERESLGSGILGGFTGIGWELSHLARHGWSVDPSAISCIDEALLRHVRTSPWERDYDLVFGLVGFGVYALGGRGRPAASELLFEVVTRLSETAIESDAGLAWRTPSSSLTTYPERTRPGTPLNAGLAHGVPGVIALLARVVARDPADERAAALLRGAVRWQMSVRDPERGAFPAWAPDARPHSNPAWCYGNPGAAYALCSAAAVLGDGALGEVARAAALGGHNRALATRDGYDLGFCHGLAGAGHLLGRLFQATGDEAARDASAWFFRRLLDRRKEGEPIADPSLLTGAIGVALVLLSAVSAGADAWDDIFLCDLPAGAASTIGGVS
ncbi:MAG TPA: lanthionine synthetase LanC family protein [Polyangiaceae bacterium]